MQSIWEASEIIKRAKQAMNFKNDSELAQFLGVSRATLSNWQSRRRIDFPLLLSKLSMVDYNWLLTGKGNARTAQPTQCVSSMASGEVQIIHNSKTTERKDDRQVPLYDISAAANLRTLLAHKHQFVVGKIHIPNIPSCDGAVYVSGDSMYPILKSGDIVGFKEISNFSSLIYGEMYLVSFNLEGDEYLAVKYVNRSDRENHIKLVSYNSHHDPMDISLDCINALAIVKFSIRRHLMM